jgi:hypothetical protein
MTGEQSRKLKVGDRVSWKAGHKDLGTITETPIGLACQSNGIIATSNPFSTTI